MRHKIVYEKWTFPADKIREGNLYLATSLLSSSLEVNTLAATVECEDPSILDFQRNAQLLYYAQPDQPMVFRVQSILRVAPTLYELSCTSTLGLLTEGQHMGGIYTGQTAQEIIADICGNVPFIVKTNLVATKLYGWLPIASPRDNLSQVLFALGAALKTDLDGVLRIAGLWDGVSGTTPQDRMYTDAKVEYSAKVTQVVLTEHQYFAGTEEKKLFEGTAQEGDVITFNAPMHSLRATGITIQARGANWARVSAGSGTLTGKEYIHNTRLITRDVQTANVPNVKTVDKATLISLVNSAATADRLVSYFKCQETINAPVVYHGEDPGNVISTFHPFDKAAVNACLQSADITLSNTLKAQERRLVGYYPDKIEDSEILNNRVELTETGSWTVPEGTSIITAVVIGPGQDGEDGKNGEHGESGTGATAPKGATEGSIYAGRYGSGGKGGEPGSPGEGGKIFKTDIRVVPGQVFSVNVNETETTFSTGNITYSSESGSRNPDGYEDIITGYRYATRGFPGIRGGDGGHGSQGGGTTLIESENGESVGSNPGGKGGKSGYSIYESYDIGKWGRGGGGAANESSGWDSYPRTDTEGVVPSGGSGANAKQDVQNSAPGCGGNGGSGGGGGGGGGAGQIDVKKTLSFSVTVHGDPGGNGGKGAPGVSGFLGCVIIYYGVKKTVQSGKFLDKNGKQFLEKFTRRFIV